jgi:hypothetical protein
MSMLQQNVWMVPSPLQYDSYNKMSGYGGGGSHSPISTIYSQSREEQLYKQQLGEFVKDIKNSEAMLHSARKQALTPSNYSSRQPVPTQ